MSKSYVEAGAAEPQKQFNIRLPKKAYTLRCIGVEFKRSKKKDDGTGDNPMLEREWEVVSPEKVKIKGEDGELREVTVQGLTIRDWLTMTAKTAKIVEKDSARLGVEIPDDEIPNTKAYEGKTGIAILGTNVIPAKDEETGEAITHGNGEPVVQYQHRINEWLN
jgi:hypothetical protein